MHAVPACMQVLPLAASNGQPTPTRQLEDLRLGVTRLLLLAEACLSSRTSSASTMSSAQKSASLKQHGYDLPGERVHDCYSASCEITRSAPRNELAAEGMAKGFAKQLIAGESNGVWLAFLRSIC